MSRHGAKRVGGAAMLTGVLALGSCTAIPAPMLASAGMNAAASSGGSFISGSMENTFVLPLATVAGTVEYVGADLRYKVRLHSVSRTTRTYFFVPENGDALRVRLTQHTPVVTTISIRVGLLGDQNLSRFLLSEIERQLPDRPVEGLR
ncbi:MAG: DUF3568 family protein [Phycisphaerales bacterium]